MFTTELPSPQMHSYDWILAKFDSVAHDALFNKLHELDANVLVDFMTFEACTYLLIYKPSRSRLFPKHLDDFGATTRWRLKKSWKRGATVDMEVMEMLTALSALTNQALQQHALGRYGLCWYDSLRRV